MTERPIIFSAPMVRAILEGRKTQTRRALKGLASDDHLRASPFVASGLETGHGREVKVPYRPGDLLWVREAWRTLTKFDHLPPRDVHFASPIQYPVNDPIDPWDSRTRSPIHMPRWASRITLIVEDVRVQRLHDISEEDAMAEGVEPILVPPDGGGTPHVEGFRDLWTTIHGPGAWDANPWVAAVTFRRQA